MRKLLTFLAILVFSAGLVKANTVASSTMYFEGSLTDNGGGVYSGILPMVDEAAESIGDLESGYDVYGKEGNTAWFGDDPGTGPEWTSQIIGTEHDAWPTLDPDTPDWYQYSLNLYMEDGQYKWAIRNHPGATAVNPWSDETEWGEGGKPPKGVPMSGSMDWTNMYALETDVGAYLPGTGTPEIPGGAATKGGGAQAWDMDWSWGSEVVPLEHPGFSVEVINLGSDYRVILTPEDRTVTQAEVEDTVAYVDSKWEMVDGEETSVVVPDPSGVEVRKCAIVCDPNGVEDIPDGYVKAHVFYPNGETFDLETLEVDTEEECGTLTDLVDHTEKCQVYTGTFDMTTSDPVGYYTVAVWVQGSGTINAITTGADRLVGNQNGDGGWGWPTGTPSCTNLAGVTGKGLYYAYKLTEDPDYMTAMMNAVNYIETHPPTYDSDCKETGPSCYDSSTSSNRGSDSNKDILFLAELALLKNDDTIAELARNRYEGKRNCYSGDPIIGAEEIAEEIFDARSGIPGVGLWDVGDWVLALYELAEYYPGQGYQNEAKAMADVMKSKLDSEYFDYNDPTAHDYYYLGLAGIKEAFETTGKYPGVVDTVRTKLHEGQNSDGSWPANGNDATPDSQTTAYVKMILDVQEAQEDKVIAAAGATWLVNNQESEGYWDDGWGEYDEVTSEGIWAIVTDISKQNRFEYVSYLGIELDADTVNFGTIRPGVMVTVDGDDDFNTKANPTVKNVGNVVADAEILGTDMYGPVNTIPVSNIYYQFDGLGFSTLTSTGTTEDINLIPDDTEELHFQLTPPAPLAVGSYQGTVTVMGVASTS
jgi:hypothetical protein